ncbi:GAF domain-containing protein [Deinococcus oregonensis]|uniref:histidine kinase n=1 Tax=Deinococcus oregonensis TaxID=1805970 RepID=A0ABV6B5A4_9DEIO
MSSQSPPLLALSPSLSQHLQAVTEALAAAHTQEEVLQIVLTPALQALNAIAGAVLLVNETGERLEIVATEGHLGDAQTLWQDGPLDADVPARDALQQHEPLFFEQEGDLVRAYPELEARTGGVACVATAVLPMFLDDAPLGTLILDFQAPHDFSPEEQRFLRTLTAQCAMALGRARLTADLQRQVQERTARVVADARAQEAFVAFTEAVGTETDLLALARQAIAVLRARFQQGSIGYYTPDGDLWKVRAWSEDMDEASVAHLQAKLPSSTHFIRSSLETGRPGFTDTWDAEREHMGHTEAYGAAAAYPLVVDGEVKHLLLCRLKGTQRWAERDRALVRAVGRSLALAVERTEQGRRLVIQNVELEARTLALERFAQLARSQETDATALIRQAQQAVTELIGEGFTVYYELDGPVWRLRSQVGSPEDAAIQTSLESALPYETVRNLRIPWESGTPFYQDTYDPALDQNEQGVPGTVGVASTAALPLRVGTRQQGIFGYGLRTGRAWTRADRATLETAVTHLGLALERAEQTHALEEERAALDALVAFNEAVGTETDENQLARRAMDVLQARFADCSGGYYRPEGNLWKLQAWTGDLNARPEFLATLRAGVPEDAPFVAQLLRERAPIFTQGWDAQRERVQGSEVYGTAGAYPVIVGDKIQGFYSVGLKDTTHWTERDRAIFRSVGRGLDLALERAEQTRRLAAQNAELEARTGALEAFVELTRNLSFHSEPDALIGRSLEKVMTLLPPGVALFHQKSENRWRATVQVGSLGTPELQATVEAGPLVGQTPSLDLPDQTGEALYQDVYNPAQDVAPELAAHLRTVATLPVRVNGEVTGIFSVSLFGPRRWSPADRAVLETTARSLGLALEGARGVAQLAQRTEELERSNAELEQFAYIASHDLQAPIRAVTSFAGVIHKRYGTSLDERGQLYLRQIMESGEHMKQLVDDLLAFSRVHSEQRPFLPTDSEAVFDAVAHRLQAEGATLTRSALPVVQADAQQLDQLLQNLISNGLKYRREGVLPEVHVSAERDGTWWRFAVSDNGIGIEPQYFERIFVIFQRLHGRESYEGTGIGLAVCKKIVERHGGRLWLESTLGQGSTFHFTLPEG